MKTARDLRSRKNKPIGVFDSGLGGLTVVRAIQQILPRENIVYFGDLARLPYGIKSKEQIRRFSVENTNFLLQHDIKALVIACNSSSSASLDLLRERFKLPVIDVIHPAVNTALKVKQHSRIGVLGTQATIDSGAYADAIHKAEKRAKVLTAACPLFVPLVEEGMLKGRITELTIRRYLSPLKGKVDVLILGCTHYPMLKKTIQKVMGSKVHLIDSAAPTVESLKEVLTQLGMLNASSGRGKLKVCVSDQPRNFIRVGERFLGFPLKSVKLVSVG